MAFGLYVGLCRCGLCLLFCWFANFLVWIFVKTRLRMYVKITSKSWKTTSKINRNLWKIHSKSTKKRPQIDENVSLERFRRQIAPRSASDCPGATEGLLLLAPVGLKIAVQGSILGPLENRGSVKNRICGHRRALWPFNNGLWKSYKNLSKSTKID